MKEVFFGPVARPFYFMPNLNVARIVVASVLGLVLVVFSLIKNTKIKSFISARFIARSGVFAAISIILYVIPIFNINVPIFPSFLNFHFDEVPAFIAGFAYGPWSAVLVIVLKTIAKIPFSSTLCVGELTDLVYSIAFVLPAAIIYKKKKTFKRVLVSFGIATAFQLIISSVLSVTVTLPFYEFVMGFKAEDILFLCQQANPNVSSLGWPYILMIILPFNAIKDVLVVIITVVLYKRLHKIIDKIGAQKN